MELAPSLLPVVGWFREMVRRLGTVTVDMRGEFVTFVLFQDGRATCKHVAAGAPSVSSGSGLIGAPRFRKEPFTIHRCAACHVKVQINAQKNANKN